RIAGEQLGWEVLDRELVDAVAEHFQWPRHTLDALDETSSSCLSGAVASWIDHTYVSQEKFVHCLANFMRAAAKRGKAVIVGRGAAGILHHYDGLKVRLVAPLTFRVERLMATQGLDARQARQIVERTDRNRREFAQRYFHHDIADRRHYDLVIDVQQAGLHGAAAQIVDAAERKFRPQPLTARAG
ncbi:MAG TPA: cytidylate kinase-like family protein, partial [Pirellulales bacterium]|nr:cytidylate kinase-like family protein [Pirellulales bacterium]